MFTDINGLNVSNLATSVTAKGTLEFVMLSSCWNVKKLDRWQGLVATGCSTVKILQRNWKLSLSWMLMISFLSDLRKCREIGRSRIEKYGATCSLSLTIGTLQTLTDLTKSFILRKMASTTLSNWRLKSDRSNIVFSFLRNTTFMVTSSPSQLY